MPYSENWNGYVAYKAQSALGADASGSGAKVLRTTGGQGGRMSKAAVESQEIRRDGLQTRGRPGSQRSNGQYTGEYSLGVMDDILAAIMRGSWGTADLQITQAAMTSITTGANTIVAAAGSWITQGIKVGDIVRLTNHSSAGNNGRNLRVVGVTASTLTIADTLTVNAVADTTFELTRTGCVLVSPAAGSLVKTYFTIEEHEFGIDQSEIFSDCVWSSLGFQMGPNRLINWSAGWTGTGKFQALSTANSPMFTTPTEPSGEPMAATEMTIRIGSSDAVDITGFSISVDNQGSSPDVIGKYGPDVFLGNQQIGLNLTVLRSDLLKVADFIADTPQTAFIQITENTADPKAFIGITVPNFLFGSVDKSALAKAGGARDQTIAVPPALVGVDLRGGAYDRTMIKFQRSNAV